MSMGIRQDAGIKHTVIGWSGTARVPLLGHRDEPTEEGCKHEEGRVAHAATTHLYGEQK